MALAKEDVNCGKGYYPLIWKVIRIFNWLSFAGNRGKRY